MFGRGKSTDYLKDKLNEGQRSAEETYEQGKDKAGAVVEEGKRRVSENAQGISDTVEDARDAAQDYIQTGREKANEYAQYGREKMDEYIGKPVSFKLCSLIKGSRCKGCCGKPHVERKGIRRREHSKL
jgi:vacuolar-type H+-ATPase subunit H